VSFAESVSGALAAERSIGHDGGGEHLAEDISIPDCGSRHRRDRRAALQSSVGSLTSGLQCVRYKAMPISEYTGYVYTSDGGKSFGVASALDVTDQGQTPTGYAALVNPSCVSASYAVRPAAFTRSSADLFDLR
jgi:hypothetical protein